MDELEKLKARAYDLIALIENAQSDLRELNIKIKELSEEKLSANPQV